MDYDKIISKTYEWISTDKIVWFLVFFWLSFPVLFFFPGTINASSFSESVYWIIILLYDIMYLAVLLGLMLLTTHCLQKTNFKSKDVSVTVYIDTVFLVFVELWHIFVWNLHKAYRFTQLLLLIGSVLLLYYSMYIESMFIDVALIIFLIGYAIIIAYNAVRISFSIPIFYSKNISVKNAVKASWHLTHKRFWKTLVGYVFAVGSVIVLFIIVSIILGGLSNLVLLYYMNAAAAYKIAVSIATLFALAPALLGYYFGSIELFSQLEREHETGTRIKRVLARRVIHSDHKHMAKSALVKKVTKVSKKKAIKKKITKKKVSKKTKRKKK